MKFFFFPSFCRVMVDTGKVETCFVLSGNDSKVHVFRQVEHTPMLPVTYRFVRQACDPFITFSWVL